MSSRDANVLPRCDWPDLPKRLQLLRERLGLSQDALARALSVNVATISRWEQGHHRPALAVWRHIVRLERGEDEALTGKRTPARLLGTAIASPAASTRFVGRERELAELTPLLTTPALRLLTLTGAGGAGKSRLALELARAVANDMDGTVGFVELAPLTDPADLHAAVASGLDLRELPGVPLLETLSTFLRSRHVLLVLDNSEHLLDACAALSEYLLQECPALRILVTSRQPLGVVGELVRAVPPLAVPADGASVEQAAASGAVQLFLDRARLQQPGLDLDPETVGPVTRICRQLEGLPLALELAAARLQLLPVGQIAGRLAASQRLLARPRQPVGGRHQSLRAALDWSYALLSPPEQALFSRLAVFAGGFTVEAAEAVCSDAEQVLKPALLDLLEQLSERSLVVREVRNGATRLRMLEPLRQYALELLQERGELEAVQERHAGWCLALAEREARRFHGPEEKPALDRLEVEHDNLRAAMQWMQSRGELSLRLGAALWWFWFQRGPFGEGQRYLDRVLAATPGLELPARAVALNAAMDLAWRQGDHARVMALTHECLRLARKLGEPVSVAWALHLQATVTWEQGNLKEGEQLHQESLALFRAAGEDWCTALSLAHLSIVHGLQGDLATADGYLKEALARFQASGDRSFIADTLDIAGVSREGRGDLEQAAEHYREALRLHAVSDDRSGVAVGLTRLAALATFEGRLQQAGVLFGAANALLEAQASRLPQFYQRYADQHLAELRARLDEERFARALAEGQKLPLPEAIDLALMEDLSPTSPLRGERLAGTDQAQLARENLSPNSPPHGERLAGQVGLSRREGDVLTLLAQGMSNKQIGEALTLSVRTVERHIANICHKTGVRGRAAAIAYAFQHGLAGKP